MTVVAPCCSLGQPFVVCVTQSELATCPMECSTHTTRPYVIPIQWSSAVPATSNKHQSGLHAAAMASAPALTTPALRAKWDEYGDVYAYNLESVMASLGSTLLAALGISFLEPGDALLDIGTGPGLVAAMAMIQLKPECVAVMSVSQPCAHRLVMGYPHPPRVLTPASRVCFHSSG